MGSWFGNLQLAYKYTIVFVSLLVLTLLAGFAKLFYDRRRLKQHAAKSETESGPSEEQMELNQREKDEGDLFGVRAIEAGFYAGIPQSRPTSRATSFVGSPSMSSTTLIGALNSPKVQDRSMASSVTSLPLAHTNDRNRESGALPADNSSRRQSPPTIKLRPSEAEISGRHNHNVAVNMSLNVPPSPVLARGPSPPFGGSDSGESSGRTSPASPTLSPTHYAPTAPRIPGPQGGRAPVVDAEDYPRSHAASFNNPSSAHSPPQAPGAAPTTKLPSLPHQVLSGGSQPPYQDYSASEARGEQPQNNSSRRPSSTVLLEPQTYQASHQRDSSNASSVYSEKRMSGYQAQQKHDSSAQAYRLSLPKVSNRISVSFASGQEFSQQPSGAGASLLAPSSAAGADKTNDPRFSEFYDAYYRNSHINMAPPKSETSKRPSQLDLDGIVEVPSPLSSPQPPTNGAQPGMAL